MAKNAELWRANELIDNLCILKRDRSGLTDLVFLLY